MVTCHIMSSANYLCCSLKVFLFILVQIFTVIFKHTSKLWFTVMALSAYMCVSLWLCEQNIYILFLNKFMFDWYLISGPKGIYYPSTLKMPYTWMPPTPLDLISNSLQSPVQCCCSTLMWIGMWRAQMTWNLTFGVLKMSSSRLFILQAIITEMSWVRKYTVTEH